MMSGIYLRQYGVGLDGSTAGSLKIRLKLRQAGSDGFATNAHWTPAAGDVTVSKDFALPANIATLPSYVNGWWEIALSDAELTAKQVAVTIDDPAIVPEAFVVETFGDSSAMYVLDYVDNVLNRIQSEIVESLKDKPVVTVDDPVVRGGTVCLYQGADRTDGAGGPLRLPDPDHQELPGDAADVVFKATRIRRPHKSFEAAGKVEVASPDAFAVIQIPGSLHADLPTGAYRYFVLDRSTGEELDMAGDLDLRFGPSSG